jgi:hypothetical protein
MKWPLIYGNYSLGVNESLNTHILKYFYTYFFCRKVTVMFEVSWPHRMACGDVRIYFGKVGYLTWYDDVKSF